MSEQLLREIIKNTLTEASLGGSGGLVKYVKRLKLMINRINDKIPFLKIDGTSFVFNPAHQDTQKLISFLNSLIHDYEVLQIPIKNASDKRYVELSKLIKTAGTPLSQLLKDSGMGGEKAGKRLSAEARQIEEISNGIESAKHQKQADSISIVIKPGKIINVDGISNIKGTPKADCALTLKSEPVAFISLKSANKPNEMGQWSGITGYQSNPAVAKFIADLYLLQASGKARLDTAYYRDVNDDDLSLKCVYGKDYSSTSGINSCDVVLASTVPISLVENDGVYHFSATHIFYNPELPGGEWVPTLYARFATGRKDAGLQDVRLSISPLGYRNKRVELPEFDTSVASNQNIINLNLKDILVDDEESAPTDDVYGTELDEPLVSWDDLTPEEKHQALTLAAGAQSLKNIIQEEVLAEAGSYSPAQDSPRNIALRLLEEHGLEIAMNIAARDGSYAVLKILTDFGPDAASDVRHFPFGRM